MARIKVKVVRLIAEVKQEHMLSAFIEFIRGLLTISQKGEELAFPCPVPWNGMSLFPP